jgi:hypothetical protein
MCKRYAMLFVVSRDWWVFYTRIPVLFFACPLCLNHWEFSSFAQVFRHVELFHGNEPFFRITCGINLSCGLLYKNFCRVQSAWLSASFCFIARNSECPSWTRFTSIEWFRRNTVAGGKSRIRRTNQKWNQSFMDLLLDGSWWPRIEVNILIVLLSDNWQLIFEFKLASETRSSFHHK